MWERKKKEGLYGDKMDLGRCHCMLGGVSYRNFPSSKDSGFGGLFSMPPLRVRFEVSPVVWAFRPKWGEKSFLKCPACNKNVWALLKKNHSFAEQKEESIP